MFKFKAKIVWQQSLGTTGINVKLTSEGVDFILSVDSCSFQIHFAFKDYFENIPSYFLWWPHKMPKTCKPQIKLNMVLSFLKNENG